MRQLPIVCIGAVDVPKKLPKVLQNVLYTDRVGELILVPLEHLVVVLCHHELFAFKTVVNLYTHLKGCLLSVKLSECK